MKQKTSGIIAVLGIFALAGCYTYQGDAINNASYTEVQATPNFATIKVGDSDQMLVRLINAANNGALTNYTLSTIPAGILVHQNLNYRPVYDPKLDTLVATGDKTTQQYFIVAVTPGKYTFTLTPTSVNTGVSATVTVAVTSINLGPALSKTSGVVGDTITVTAPPGLVFSQKSVLTFPGGFTPVIVSRAADSTSFRAVVGAGTGGVAAGTPGIGSVTLVGVAAVPEEAPITDTTTNTFITPPGVTSLNPTISNLTPNLGDNITVTLPAGFRFVATSTISTATAGTDSVGTIISMSADSTSAVWNPNPSSNGAVHLNNIAYTVFPTGAFNVVTSPPQVVHVIAPTLAPTIVSTNTPAFGATMTLTLTAGLRFLPTSTFSIGGSTGELISISADSSTATVVPVGESSGLLKYSKIVLGTVPKAPLSIVSDQSITVGPTSSDPNAATMATAPTLVIPPAGTTTVFSDGGVPFTAGGACDLAGGDGCRYYKVVLAAPAKVDMEIRWNAGTTTDLGLYLIDAAATGATTLADAKGPQAGGPEVSAATITLPAGTSYIAVVWYASGPSPASYAIKLTGRQ